MSRILIVLLFLSSLMLAQSSLANKETLSLVGTASTATDTSAAMNIGDRVGSITLFCDGTVNSGTATAITLTAQVQPKGDTSNWFAVNGSTSMSVGVISAAQLTADNEVFIVLSDLTWWGWAQKYASSQRRQAERLMLT